MAQWKSANIPENLDCILSTLYFTLPQLSQHRILDA